MRRVSRVHQRAKAVGIGALIAAAFASPAAAHPHVWITVESTVLYERGSIIGVQHQWTFDEFYTAMAIQGLDTNNDGIYDRQELAELAQVNMDGLKEFGYFTHVRLGDQSLAFEAPRDPYLEYGEVAATGESQPAPAASKTQDGSGVMGRMQSWLSGGAGAQAKPAKPKALKLHFTLPLAQPVLAEAPGFTFAVSDPTFFIAFELAKNNPVKIGAGAPAGCRISIGGSEREVDDAKRLSESFFSQVGAQGFGLSLAKPVSVICDSK